MTESQKERINCLYCNDADHSPWASENGYTAVRCKNCGLIFVNPRPVLSLISEAVQTGVHTDVDHGRTAIGKRSESKVNHYKRLISRVFYDVWENGKSISWIDVGAGYGEIIEAVTTLASTGSQVVGLEPMRPKAQAARSRGLHINEWYLHDEKGKYDFLSLINVYSHIPDFRAFLIDVKNVLNLNGQVLIETGNTADLKNRQEVPGELDLPDHLVFAGETHLKGYLTEAGFSIISIQKIRVDNLLRFTKNLVKKAIGRKEVSLRLPYSSPYRSLIIRAKLTKK